MAKTELDHTFYFRMSTNQMPESKETFNLERAEEDDEFEEFEKDGSIRF